jgi:predicted enzyme related to lactoylglutathione lyase
VSSEIPLGRFVWHELMASDPTAAQAFYPQLTGWSTKVWDGGTPTYTMWMNGDKGPLAV